MIPIWVSAMIPKMCRVQSKTKIVNREQAAALIFFRFHLMSFRKLRRIQRIE